MFSGALSMLVAISALAVDTASLYNDKRRLQAAADAAALAAAADPQSGRTAAAAAIAANGGTGGEMDRFDLGIYTPDPAIASTARFVTGAHASMANAAKVHLQRPANTIFARAIGVERFITIEATATAARIDLAGFSLGARLASVEGGLVNSILSGLAGTNLNLTVADYNGLAGADVDILRFLDVLKTDLDLNVATFDDVLDANVSLPQAVNALAGAVGTTPVGTLLRTIAAKVPNRDVPLSAIIDLGPLGSNAKADSHRPISVDVLSALRTVLELSSPTRQVSANVGLNLPGLASTTLKLQIGERAQSSPWLAVTGTNSTVVRTAQARVLLDVVLGAPGPLSLGEIHLPLYVEMASATGQLASVSCRGGRNAATASLDVTPSTGQVGIGTVDTARFDSFGSVLEVQPATIASVTQVNVKGRAAVNLSNAQTQRLQFSASQIQNHTVQTASASVQSQAIVTSLLKDLDLQVNLLGLGLGLGQGPITSAVLTTLGAVAAPVDALLASVLSLAGTRIGQADAWVNGVRCGTPILVA